MHERIEKVFAEVQDWYFKTYNQKFDVIARYDKVEKKHSWQIRSYIGGADRVLQVAMHDDTMNSIKYDMILAKLPAYLRGTLVKAHAKYAPTEAEQEIAKL